MRFVVALLFASLLSGQSLTMVTGCSGTVPGGAGNYTVTVSGSGFAAGVGIAWDGTPLATTLLGPTQIAAVLPPTIVPPSGSAYTISVTSGGVVANCVLVMVAPAPAPPVVPPVTAWVSATKAVVAMSDPELTAVLSGATWQQMVRRLLTAVLVYLQTSPSTTSILGYIIPIPQQLELVRALDPAIYTSMVSARGQ